MLACSLIVPIRSHASLTRPCLDRLIADASRVAEVIVVDASATDRTSALLESYGPRIRSVMVDADSGAAAARNAGAAAASHPLLLFVDATTMPREGWLEPLLECAERHPDTAVVGGKLLDAGDTVLHAGVVIGQDRMPRLLYHGFPADHPAVNRTRALQIVSGGYLLVKRAPFEQAGGFDASYTGAFYDADLCLRLGSLGFQARYCHESVANRLDVAVGNGLAADGDRTLFRARWTHRARPDDLDYYIRDGLLRVVYDGPGPVRLSVSPLLASVDESALGMQAATLLAERTRQVQELSAKSAALVACVRDLEAGGHRPARPTPMSVAVAAVAAAAPAENDRAAVDDELMPPSLLSYSVGGRFREDGEEYFQYFRAIGGLQPTHRVLDIGCGVGRMAVKLAPFLDGGSYEGFDIRLDVIEWCQQHITPRYPQARFAYLDIANGFYNDASSNRPSAFRFPYPRSSFDFVLLTSVFTHMLPADLQQYTAEIVAVLKPGGTCFCTYFLLNEESLGLMRAGLSGVFDFKHRGDGYRAIQADMPEAALAYDENWIREVYRSNGLRIVEPIRFGHWCGRLNGLSLQDIVIAVKEPAPG